MTGPGVERRASRRYRVLWESGLAEAGASDRVEGAVGDISAHGARFIAFSANGLESLRAHGKKVLVFIKTRGWVSGDIVWAGSDSFGLRFDDELDLGSAFPGP